jgi:hypothetical protein
MVSNRTARLLLVPVTVTSTTHAQAYPRGKVKPPRDTLLSGRTAGPALWSTTLSGTRPADTEFPSAASAG